MRNKLKTALQNATNTEKARPYLALWKKQKHSIKDNTTKIRSKTDRSAHEIGECQNKTGTKQTEHIKKNRRLNTKTRLDRRRHKKTPSSSSEEHRNGYNFK